MSGTVSGGAIIIAVGFIAEQRGSTFRRYVRSVWTAAGQWRAFTILLMVRALMSYGCIVVKWGGVYGV